MLLSFSFGCCDQKRRGDVRLTMIVELAVLLCFAYPRSIHVSGLHGKARRRKENGRRNGGCSMAWVLALILMHVTHTAGLPRRKPRERPWYTNMPLAFTFVFGGAIVVFLGMIVFTY
ncbi:hypothetical protein F5Y18DRAFT_178134 [Xylariaceae sp. FL1019]|nr:hypothetical protein F5Y18DRAFT_178134 [Xylariaceae sp. FL1019]